MKVAIALLALVAFAQIAVAQSDVDDSLLFDTWGVESSSATVRQQRTLLQSSPPTGYSPRYSPSPAVYSPSPAVYSPRPSPTPSPSPIPGKSPKPCKFTTTLNVNYYSVTIRSTKNWGAGRDAIFKAAEAVYIRYSQQRKFKVKVTGAGGQEPQKPFYDFTYLVEVPVTPCAGFKEGLRSSLRTAIKKVKAKGQIKAWFHIIA